MAKRVDYGFEKRQRELAKKKKKAKKSQEKADRRRSDDDGTARPDGLQNGYTDPVNPRRR